MSKDLILGRTPRDWSCGSVPLFSTQASRHETASDVLAQSEVGPLADSIERNVRSCYDRVVRLHSAGRMPPDQRRSFGQLLRRWQELKESRRGGWLSSDYVELANFRDELGRRSAELAALEAARPSSAPDHDDSTCRDCSRGTSIGPELARLGAVAGASYLIASGVFKLLKPRKIAPRISRHQSTI
jgi:hypothetical protein